MDAVLRGRIAAAASRVRAVLTDVPISESSAAGFGAFPNGWCGHARELLCAYLTDLRLGEGGFVYVAGERKSPPYQSHAWVECAGLIIDITADQFDNALPPVWLTTDCTWHAQFGRQERRRADVSNTADLSGWLSCLYQRIRGDGSPPPAI